MNIKLYYTVRSYPDDNWSTDTEWTCDYITCNNNGEWNETQKVINNKFTIDEYDRFIYKFLNSKTCYSENLNIRYKNEPLIIIYIIRKDDLTFAPSECWNIAREYFQPEQKVHEIIYIKFQDAWINHYSDCRMISHNPISVPARIIKQTNFGYYVEVSIPGTYGMNFGHHLPYRYYFLSFNSKVIPTYNQNLEESIPFNIDNIHIKFNTYKNITNELPAECCVCMEENKLMSCLTCFHILCNECAHKCTKCPLCRKEYRELDIYDI